MPDNLTQEDRIRTMRAVKSEKTGPERRLRALLAGLRIRGWRVNPKGIEGKPDAAFPEKKIVIFVDGCFWHGCPVCQRTLPETNREYWARKIERNVARDQKYNASLAAAGWRVLRIWEHQLAKNASLAPIAAEIKALLDTEPGA